MVAGVSLVCAATVFLTAAETAEKPQVNYDIPLWERGKVPGALGDFPLDNPVLTVSLPQPGKANGAAIIVLPGGGNTTLFAHQEGMAVAEKLNDLGIAAFVLTYRMSPRYSQEDRLRDGHRAMQVVRSKASEFKLDPKRIGMAGFSAGGNLIRPVAAKPLPGDPSSADPVERVSSRPDFVIMVYGPGRGGPGEDLKNFPPAFIMAAAADSTSTGSAQLFLDLKKAGASPELHLYQNGRHGFGLAEGVPGLSDWPGRLESWLRTAGFLGAEGKP